jgi:hypothetical protein
MAAITVLNPSITGTLAAPVAAAAGGDTVANPRGNVYVRVINGGGSSINVTVKAQVTARPADNTFPAGTLADQVVPVLNGTSRVIGPIPPAFVDGSGNVQLTYSAVTSVTVEAWNP